jgi:beta-xylosidase
MTPMNTALSTPPTQTAAAANWPWQPDLGNGRYRNPILYADYSDPDVVRVGDDFYLTASSFNCTPALPILHSTDLVNWRLINYAVKNLPAARFEQFQPGCGVWAPAIRHHAGKFWIFFPMPDEGIYVTTATDPAGAWSEPHLLQAGKGLIDPCPLWDDDGQAYLVHAYAGSRAGIKHRLRVCPMAPDGSRLLGEGQIVFHEPEKHPTLEGPKFLKRDGWYYILAPAGGVATGWQLALRSRNVFGPYEDRVLLAQGSTNVNGPHQGALVDTAKGDWWFLHFQDAGVYGRIVHLQPVEWVDGWPYMGIRNANGVGEPVLEHSKPALPSGRPEILPTSDEFSRSKLGLQWQWQANHREDWFSLTDQPGRLRLYAQAATATLLNEIPNLLLQKFPARSFCVETSLEWHDMAIGCEAGLVIAGRSSAAVAMSKDAEGCRIMLRTDEGAKVLTETSGTRLRLRVQVTEGGVCEFSYADVNGDFVRVAPTFQATPGVWIGAKVGIYAIQTTPRSKGHVDFDYFRFVVASGIPA